MKTIALRHQGQPYTTKMPNNNLEEQYRYDHRMTPNINKSTRPNTILKANMTIKMKSNMTKHKQSHN